MAKDEMAPMFDWALYGMVVRKRRTELGYKKAEHFSASIWRRTRVPISRDSMYKIEQGKQTPTGMQMLAINLSLYGQPFPEELFDICSSRAWKSIARIVRETAEGDCLEYDSIDAAEFIPDQWKHENFSMGLLEGGYEELNENASEEEPPTIKVEPTPTIKEMAHRLDDDPMLFLD